MTEDSIRTLPDAAIEQVIAWAQDEQKTRVKKRKREIIAKIKEMAQTVGVSVSVERDRRKKSK